MPKRHAKNAPEFILLPISLGAGGIMLRYLDINQAAIHTWLPDNQLTFRCLIRALQVCRALSIDLLPSVLRRSFAPIPPDYQLFQLLYVNYS